jgi:predicted Zn-ribbon and HTH transcriptional regulator
MGELEILRVSDRLPSLYERLFVNRRAFTRQTDFPNRLTGRHYYYRPTERGTGRGIFLDADTVRRHLAGWVTIGLYAINPETACSKWLAIDADYDGALAGLGRLAELMRADSLNPALEESRRGGHLWLFMGEPVPAARIRVYVYDAAARAGVPIKLAGKDDGIEIFPKQDALRPGEFGSAIRGPLGVHRGAGRRFWFQGAARDLEAQMDYLISLPKLGTVDLARLIEGKPALPESRPGLATGGLPGNKARGRRGFQILEHIQTKLRRSGRNLITACPSCRAQGHDQAGDNLSISVDGEKYKCWAGCSRDAIRAALGCPWETSESALRRICGN